ncbi:MAG TPA: hypothetical protein VJ024_01395 [Thermodesulfovibrionales bacterium]|nr:hypothetical protein [Thermodesulfovibrionales bacterium]
MKITIAWNVWNNYLDTALGSEILRLENQSKGIFDELHLISQGGYPEPPSGKYSQYLDGHFFVDYPKVPLIEVHPKFVGVFRVIEGIQKAFRYAEQHHHDFAVITNADGWFLSIEKLYGLLRKEELQNAAVSMRIGLVTGLELNFGSCVPLFDDHFMILNVRECQKHRVFDYDHSARFFAPHFGHMGGIHNILCCFTEQRVPKGKFYIYTSMEDALGQYGDYCGWRLLPWQYQPSTAFLHANCAQMPSLNGLRAAFLRDFGYTKYPLIKEYYEEVSPDCKKFIRRHGVLVYKRDIKRKTIITLYWQIRKIYHHFLRRKYERYFGDRLKKTLYYYDKHRHIMPANLTG